MTEKTKFETRSLHAVGFTAAGMLASATGNLCALWAVHSLWAVPPGSVIWPIGVTTTILVSALLTPLAVVPFAVLACRKGKHLGYWMLAAVMVVLALLPWMVSGWYLGYIATTNNLTFQ